jgi:hypothetical protein
MKVRRTSIAALLLAGTGALGLLAGQAGTAQATTIQLHFHGPFAGENLCNIKQAEAAASPPPGTFTVNPCFFSDVSPVNPRLPLEGWYFSIETVS